MKKSFVLLSALVLLAVGTVYYAQTSILKEKDNVQFTENVLYGDKSIVEGVTVEMKNHYRHQLFWDSTYVIGENPAVTTDYEFYAWNHGTYDISSSSSLLFETYYKDHFDPDYLENNSEELELAMMELYHQTEPGEEKEILVYVKDYVDYYPFHVEMTDFYDSRISIVRFNSLQYEDIESPTEKEQEEKLKRDIEVLEIFREFFKIPVLENEVCMLAMKKDSEGNVIGWGNSSMDASIEKGDIEIPYFWDWEKYDSFSFYTISEVENGDCYFTFDPHTYQGSLVDVSQIPGGYGIYHFTYDEEKNELYPEELKMVYPLDTSVAVYDMFLDKSGKNLLLFTTEGDYIYMSIIDVATMTFVDKIEVSTSECGIHHYWLYEDYMVIYGENMVLLTIDENGTYTKQFAESIEKIQELENRSILSEDIVFDWNGEKLIFADCLYNSEGFKECRFYVGAMDATGLLYLGTYDSSLVSTYSYDDNNNYYFSYSHCCPIDNHPITISWE